MAKRRWTYFLLALNAAWILPQQASAQVSAAKVQANSLQGITPTAQVAPAAQGTPGAQPNSLQSVIPGVKAKPTAMPHSKPALATEAATRASDGDYLGAIQVWSRVIQLGPDKLQGYLQRAKLKRQLGDQKGAVQDLDLALKINPNSAACLLERATLRRRLSDYKGALEDLNKALELQPQKADAYVERGWLKMALGDYVGSFTDYHTAVAINPALKGRVANMAQPQVSTRLDTEASGTTTKVEHSPVRDERQSPASAFADKKRIYSQAQLARLNNASARQINDGQFEEAIKTLNELIAAAPDYGHARENLTIAHNNWGLELAKRTPAEAAKQFRQALYLDPSQGASRRNLEAMIKEIGKDPKDVDDRLAMANESLAGADNKGAFVEASEAAKIKNTPSVRAALRKALNGLNEKDEKVEKVDKNDKVERSEKVERNEKNEKAPLPEVTVLGQLKPMVGTAPTESPTTNFDQQTGEVPALTVIEQAKTMAQAGQTSDAEALLDKLINHIKSRAAIDESADFTTLDLALDTLIDMYLKSGSYVQAQTNLSELVILRESAKDRGDPILGTTYRQYAKVLSALNRAAEAKIYEDKAAAILDSKQANR